MINSAVARKIGTTYKGENGWKKNRKEEGKYADRIFIDAPTGSGKTTFILQTLLPHYSACNKKILYLVNRRILKEQIREMVAELPHSQMAAIRVELYQEIERKISKVPMKYSKVGLLIKREKDKEKAQGDTQNNGGNEEQGYDYSQLEKLSEYDCVVCDEAHYFLTDSSYNTNTVFSFRWIQDVFRHKVCIFMSATIHELKSYMETKNLYEYGESNTKYYEISKYDPSISKICNDLHREAGEAVVLSEKHEIKTYCVDRDYSYIENQNIRIIYNRKALADLVVEGNFKWIIFVDNINYGKALRNSIRKKLRKIKKNASSDEIEGNVILITSGYKRDHDSTDEVDRIIRTQAPSAKILIVTAVLDNGVNIKDIDVRNIVLFADTETEFIQMLGRKRKDAKQLKLYIYGYDKNHFSNRKRQLRKQKEIADNYLCDIEEIIKKIERENLAGSWEDKNNKERLFERENACIEDQHNKMMQQIADGYVSFEDVRHSFTVYDGKWHLNLLSLQNIENLMDFYKDVIRRFEEEGEDAFAREQLSWLGKTGKVADEIIKNSKLTEERESRERVIAVLRGIAGKKMDKGKWIDFTDGMHEDLKILAAHPVDFPDVMECTNEQIKRWNTVKGEFSKMGKPLSKQSMEFLCTYCRIPFQVENDRKGGYMIKFSSH